MVFSKQFQKLCALLYKKCLSLNADGRRSITIGRDPHTAWSTHCEPRYDIFQFKIDRSTLVRGSLTIGKIINIMSVDVNRCDRILLPFSNISVSPILVSIAIWQIYVRMGNAIWGALGTTVFFLLLNIGQDRVQEQVSTDRIFCWPLSDDFGSWIPVWEVEDNFGA